MSKVTPKPWTPAQATHRIREKANQDPQICWTAHAKERMEERGLIMGDLMHVLQNGTVFDEAEPTTEVGLYKYRMECQTPNSQGRSVRVVVIPYSSATLKIVTIMWVDF